MLSTLPNIPTQRLAVHVKSAAEKMLHKGHPWVFESSIIKINKEGKAGDIAIIFDKRRNKFLALGLYDPYSPIRIKVLQIHKPATINETWFKEKINTAFAKRRPLLTTDTNSYRLIHGENDGLPSFIADVYANVLVVKLYALIWLPYLKEILPILKEISQCSTIILRLSRNVQQHSDQLYGLNDGQILEGSLDQPTVIFKEHGLRFSANVIDGHKTGYFLDHRHNRKQIGDYAKGKKVLDVFAYAGGFSVHALAGGATEVWSLDISAQALKMAQQNALLNLKKTPLKTISKDAFKALQEMNEQGEQFDIVVVDPPSFAKQASEMDRALHSYARLTRLAAPLVSKGGLLVMASCSSRISSDDFFDTVHVELRKTGRFFKEIDRTFHDIDHPISFPEGAYLKCGYFRKK